jgi:cytochrome c oxidase cbb3-type subunit III
MKNSVVLLVFASVCGFSAFAQEAGAARQAGSEAAPVSAAATLFKQTCGFCHGPDGRGANGPDLIRSTLVSHDVGGNLIGPVVHNGRPEKGMPAFPLTDIQIREIADYLHSEAKLASSVTQGSPDEYPLAKLLVGNADAGRAYFNGRGKCSGCHSPAGDFAHIATKYKPLDLQKRIAFPWGAVPTVMVMDGLGTKYSGDQVYADEFTISLRDRTGWIRSWKRSTVKVEIHNPLAPHEALLTTYTDKAIHDLFAYLETLK